MFKTVNDKMENFSKALKITKNKSNEMMKLKKKKKNSISEIKNSMNRLKS